MYKTIPYTSKRLRKTLIMTLGYWLLFYLNVFGIKSPGYILFGFLLLAVFSTYMYFRERKLQYLTLKDGVLIRNDIWGRSIRLQEVTEIEKYAGDYILKSPKKKFRIDTHIITPEGLEALEKVLADIPLNFAKS